MDAYIRISGKTVEDALLEASIQLGTTSDNVDYRVIEHETKGFLGIGAKKAVIEARLKKPEENIIDEVFRDKGSDKKKKKKDPAEKVSGKSSDKKEKDPEKKNSGKKADDQKQEKTAKTVKKAEKTEKKQEKKQEKNDKKDHQEQLFTDINEDENEAPVTEENKEMEETGMEEMNPETAALPETEEKIEHEKTPRVPADPEVVKERAVTFLEGMLKAMDLPVDIETRFEDDVLYIELKGDDMGVIIGKRGQTLDSVQYLTSLVVNKGKAAYVRVKVDTEDYRARRKATLENLAKNIAFKVKKTRRSVYLEPMNPYERRIIHSALQSDPYVTTHSEGEEPMRKVVVTLKKRERAYNDEYETEK